MHQNQWVVRSSGRILGPFSTAEVVRRLESRNISILDEVSAPYSRWAYIRDKKQFSKIVDRLQNESYSGREDTKTATISGHTQTMTVTDVVDRKSPPTESLSGIKDVQHKKDYELSRPARVYGESAEGQNSLSKKLYLVAIALVLGFVGYYILFVRVNSSVLSVQQDSLQKGHMALSLGHYSEAKIHFANAYASNPEEPDIVLNYSALLIANGETVKGKRIFEKIFSYNLSRELRRKADLLMGIAGVVDQDYNKAAAYFERYTDFGSPKGPFVPASLNLGIGQSMSEDYGAAEVSFANLTNKVDQIFLNSLPFSSPDDSFFFRAYNLSLHYVKKPKRQYLVSAREAAMESAKRSPRYRYESYLLLIWINAKLDRAAEANEYVTRLLDTDPSLSDEHVRSLFIYNNYVSWKKLHWFCMDARKNLKASARLSAVLAMCEHKVDNTYQVRKHIQDAIAQSSQDGLVKATESFLLMEAGEFGNAETTLDSVLRGEEIFALPHLLKGRICWVNGDSSCALKNWTVAYNKSPVDIIALTGLARYYMKMGNEQTGSQRQTGYQRAKELVARGLKVSPSFQPLLKLKDKIDQGY